MSEQTDTLLYERAVQAESQLRLWRARAEELQERIEAVVDDPLLLARGLNNEVLLIELHQWLTENPSVGELLPTGFAQRLTAQMRFHRFDDR